MVAKIFAAVAKIFAAVAMILPTVGTIFSRAEGSSQEIQSISTNNR